MEKASLSRVIFILGLPGTGKTYLARHLADASNTKHLSSDKVRKEIQKRGQYQPEDKQQVYREMQLRMIDFLMKNENVIIDATFYKKELREVFQKIAKQHTNEIYWILTTANEEVIQERVSKKRPDSEADFKVYQLIRDQFEPLRRNFLEIQTDRFSIEENLKLVIQYCNFNYDSKTN